MRTVAFFVCNDQGVYSSQHLVDDEVIELCYRLPKDFDRFAYWAKITGDNNLLGHVMVWSPL